jgi:hypothetical protein
LRRCAAISWIGSWRASSRALRPSVQWRRELQRRFDPRDTAAANIRSMVRAASRGRTDELYALTELEAMTIHLHLESGA